MGSFLDDYQPVEDRLRLFWEEHPYGRVITELLHHEDGDYIVLASVFFGDETKTGPPTATGLAHDSTATLPANMKTSALEVCETSAIGRALANAGYAPKDKRPSREEMAKASGGSTAAVSEPEPSGQPAPGEVAGPPEEPSPKEKDLADPAQWAKAASLGMRKVDVLKAVQNNGQKVTKASDVTRAQLAEVIAAFGG